jgi:hypothetical protein
MLGFRVWWSELFLAMSPSRLPGFTLLSLLQSLRQEVVVLLAGPAVLLLDTLLHLHGDPERIKERMPGEVSDVDGLAGEGSGGEELKGLAEGDSEGTRAG